MKYLVFSRKKKSDDNQLRLVEFTVPNPLRNIVGVRKRWFRYYVLVVYNVTPRDHYNEPHILKVGEKEYVLKPVRKWKSNKFEYIYQYVSIDYVIPPLWDYIKNFISAMKTWIVSKIM